MLINKNPIAFQVLEYIIYIKYDFRTWLNIDIELRKNKDISILFSAIKKIVKDNVEVKLDDTSDPKYITEVLIEKLKWFLVGGKVNKKSDNQSNEILFDWEVDEKVIYSAFWKNYRIDLDKKNLHWFSFLAMFNDLSDCVFTDYYMKYRGMTNKDIKSYSKEEQQRIRQIKQKVFINKIIEVEDPNHLDNIAKEIEAKRNGR